MRLLISVVVLMTTLTGCASVKSAGTSGMTIISGVPVFAGQVRDDDCASVALASLLAHAGHHASPSAIDREVYDLRLKGSLLPDMENYAAGQGATPRSGRGDLEFLRDRIIKGTPVLMPIDLGWGAWRRPHYVVVYGFGNDNFLLHMREGEPAVLNVDELERRWAKLGALYLYLE